MSAAAAPDAVTGYGNSGSAADILTANSFCNVEGGVAPLTYLWEEVSATGVWNITDADGSFTSFEAEAVDPLDTRTAQFKCTVTDANGETAETNTVTASAINLGGA